MDKALQRNGRGARNFSTARPELLRRAQAVAEQDYRAPSMLQDYLHTFLRYRWIILGSAIVGSLICLCLGLHTLPVYQTQTTLDIRSLNRDFLGMNSVSATNGDSGAEGDVNLQTQIKLLQTDTLKQDTIGRMLAESHPAFIERADVISVVRRALHLGHVPHISYTAAVEETAKQLKVKPQGLTRLVEITCSGWTPDIATKFCNTLSDAFEAEDLEIRSTEASKVSSWLTRQVADVRTHAQETQAKLEAAVGGDGLILSQTSSSVGEEHLRAIQGELVRAESDRMRKEAEVNIDRAASPGTQPTTGDDSVRRAYEAKLVDLRSQLSASMPPLTEENPKIIRLRSEIRDAERGLQQAETVSSAREVNELEAARHREALLNITYETQLARVSADLQRAAKVSLLKSELDSEQHLYQTLLERAKEAGFASAMQASTIRVVDTAKEPLVAFSPRRKVAAIVGGLLGLLCGTIFAFYKERTLQVLRSPGDISRHLHLEELGVIPVVRSRKFEVVSRSRKLIDAPPLMKPQLTSARADSLALSCWSDRFSIAAEAYRNVTFSILNSEASTSSRTYVVSSPKAGEGKTTIASNLGVALSKAKLNVVLVDGDLRKPNLHNTFSVDNSRGFGEILRGDIDLEKTSVKEIARETSIPNLSVIPAGQCEEDPVELLHSAHFKKLLSMLSKEFNVVLIDTPPTLHMVDTRIIARNTDGVILVVRSEGTTLEEAINARDLFERDGVNLLGTILNSFDPGRNGRPGYYDSYHQYSGAGPKPGVAV